MGFGDCTELINQLKKGGLKAYIIKVSHLG